MSDEFREALRLSEESVRAGRVALAARELAALDWARGPRALRLPAANLCRRVGLLRLGLQILAPVVRSERAKTESDASPAETAEYAVLLQRSGAVREALRLLEGVDARSAPEASLYRAFCFFNLWDYERALAPLADYLAAAPTEYAGLVGRVNQLAALAATRRWAELEEAFGPCLELARRLGAARLAGNCREIRAQSLIARDRLVEAEDELRLAAAPLPGAGTLDALFVRKWEAVLESRRRLTLAPLAAFRVLAERASDPESVRETDLHALVISRLRGQTDHSLLERLWFGTPFPAYRERIREEAGAAPAARIYAFGEPGGAQVDLLRGGGSLNPGKKPHQALAVLLRDFYRPLSLGALFSELYPLERYDAFSSPDRLHQALRRARAWLREEGLPAEIVERGGRYALVVTGAVQFLVSSEGGAPDGHAALLERARSAFADGRAFSSSEACALLGVSLSSFKRFAARATTDGVLRRQNSGRATEYRFEAFAQPRAA